MGNTIQIRHGSTVPTTSDLPNSYELGFTTSTDSLYINNGSSIVRIGQKVLSGTSTPAAANGEDNDLYIQYSTSGNTTTVDAMFVKLSGTWVEISTGGGGGGGGGTVLTQTLTAGSTSVTFTNAAITTTSMYQEFTSIYGVHATSIAISTGVAVLTYEAQQYDMTVALAISTLS